MSTSRWPAGCSACPARATTNGCAGAKSARAQENELLLKHIEKIHAESRGTYGWPRVHAELTLGLGLAVNHKRVARLMREAGIQGLYRRRRRGCTVRDPARRALPRPGRPRFHRRRRRTGCGVTDITEHPTREGKLYCAAVIDAYSRRIVGWSIDDNMRTELVIDALGMAIIRRRPTPAKLHDPAFRPRLAIHILGVRATPASLPACSASMGTVGDCYDNAMMESFWGTMQLELLDSRTWETRAELANAIFEWIECWYNPQAAPFQHRNAQPTGLRSPPHRPRSRSLTRGLSLRRRGVDLYAVRVAEANGVVGGVRGVASPGPGRGRAARCEGRREHRPRPRWSIGRAACPT